MDFCSSLSLLNDKEKLFKTSKRICPHQTVKSKSLRARKCLFLLPVLFCGMFAFLSSLGHVIFEDVTEEEGHAGKATLH